MPNDTIIAIIAITILATTALILGAEANILSVAIAAIAGLAGFKLGKAT